MANEDTRFEELRALAERLEGMPPGLDPELFKKLLEDMRGVTTQKKRSITDKAASPMRLPKTEPVD
jgi:uncharacterized ParB-like nuclease family protein|tara:strand:- start:375 stop:572 length:198 start_codon:yes stop_codon:yes gene_type:complete